MARKPTVITSKSKYVYPKIQVEDGRIWMQNVRYGKWVKVPLGRAKYIKDRLNRAIKHISSK